MQGSCAVLDQWFTNKIREIGAARAIERAWDIGCGGEDEGKTPTAATAKRGKVVKKIFPAVHLRGSEPDERALQPEEYDEWDRLSVEDILEQRIFSVPAWDLIVFGDVLEHVPYSVGLSIIDWAYHNTSWVIALWPTNYVHGTGKDGNRLEVPLSHYEQVDFIRYRVLEFRQQPAGQFYYNGVVLRGLRDRSKEATPA
jgi:hypothetical protein